MSSSIAEFSAFHQHQFNLLTEFAKSRSLFQEDCARAVQAFGQSAENLQDVFEASHQAQRLIRLYMAGLENNADFRAALDRLDIPSWKDFESVDVDASMQESLARKLYQVKKPESDIFTFEMGDKSKLVAEYILKFAKQDGVEFSYAIRDPDFMTLVLNHCDGQGAKIMTDYLTAPALKANRRAIAYPLMPEEILVEPAEGKNDNQEILREGMKAVREKSGRGEAITTLTFLPTRAEAAIDQIPYTDYTRLFFEMCDQPWQQISDAQKFLIEQFNRASHARFTNDWGTDIAMELVDEKGRPFTFCNSLIDKNVPGSEIFSAPRRDSVNGRIVSRGRFHNDDSKIIENLRLHFANGCLDTWGAEKGLEHFTRFVEHDQGNRYVGELGIGTNPHLKQHVSNGLLVEKIGGSFHLALGSAYTMTDYMGAPVYVDNGNRSKDHWDITTMLYGAGGVIYLDGKKVMENGYFLDERLDVLNRGWAAIPETKRPDYWKSHPTPFALK